MMAFVDSIRFVRFASVLYISVGIIGVTASLYQQSLTFTTKQNLLGAAESNYVL